MNHNNIFGNKQQNNNRLAELAKRNLAVKPNNDNADMVISQSASAEARELSSFAYSWAKHGFAVNSQVIAHLEKLIYAGDLTGREAIELYEQHMSMSNPIAIILD